MQFKKLLISEYNPKKTSKVGLKTTPPQSKPQTNSLAKISRLLKAPNNKSINKLDKIGIQQSETTLSLPLTLMDRHGLLSQPRTQLDSRKIGLKTCKPNWLTINGLVIKPIIGLISKERCFINLQIIVLSQRTCTNNHMLLVKLDIILRNTSMLLSTRHKTKPQ